MVGASQPVHERPPSPTASASRKKQQTSQSVASLSKGAQPSILHPPVQQSSGALRRGPTPVGRSKKPKTVSLNLSSLVVVL